MPVARLAAGGGEDCAKARRVESLLRLTATPTAEAQASHKAVFMASGNHPRRRRPGASLLNGWPRRDLTDAVAASLLLSVEALLTAFGCSSWRVRLPLWVVSARPRRLRAAVGPRRRRRLRHTKSERPLPSITTFRYRPANACYLVRTGHPRKKRPQAAMGRRRTVTKLTSLPESRNSSRDSKTGPSRPTAAGQCELMALPGPLPGCGPSRDATSDGSEDEGTAASAPGPPQPTRKSC